MNDVPASLEYFAISIILNLDDIQAAQPLESQYTLYL